MQTLQRRDRVAWNRSEMYALLPKSIPRRESKLDASEEADLQVGILCHVKTTHFAQKEMQVENVAHDIFCVHNVLALAVVVHSVRQTISKKVSPVGADDAKAVRDKDKHRVPAFVSEREQGRSVKTKRTRSEKEIVQSDRAHSSRASISVEERDRLGGDREEVRDESDAWQKET